VIVFGETSRSARTRRSAERSSALVASLPSQYSADRDIWAAALLVVKRYGDDAMVETAERADPLLEEGDMAGAGIAAGAGPVELRPRRSP